MFIGTTPKSIAITISGISEALFNNLVYIQGTKFKSKQQIWPEIETQNVKHS